MALQIGAGLAADLSLIADAALHVALESALSLALEGGRGELPAGAPLHAALQISGAGGASAPLHLRAGSARNRARLLCATLKLSAALHGRTAGNRVARNLRAALKLCAALSACRRLAAGLALQVRATLDRRAAGARLNVRASLRAEGALDRLRLLATLNLAARAALQGAANVRKLLGE